MKLLFKVGAVAVSLVAALVVIQLAKSTPNQRVIYVVNNSTTVSQDQVKNSLPAFQQALDTDFYKAWGTTATLVLTNEPPSGQWLMTIQDTSEYGAGYHSVNRNNVPFSVVGTDYADIDWQIVFSHELWEMLADPYIDRATYVPPTGPYGFPKGTFYNLEVADPVETRYYQINGSDGYPVKISDFVTEHWYDCKKGDKYDQMGLVNYCHKVLPGGYAVKFTNGVWKFRMSVFPINAS